MSDNDNPGNVIYDATVSAGEGEMAANTRAHDGVTDAVTNSTDRRSAATEARNQQYKSAASSGGAKLSATFADIEKMAITVKLDVDASLADSGRIGGVIVNSDLVGSAILSPGTALLAEGAVGIAAASLLFHSTTANAVFIVSATIVTTYQEADLALSMAAVFLGSVGDNIGEQIRSGVEITGAVLAGAGDIFVNSLVGSAGIAWSLIQTAGAEIVIHITIDVALVGLVYSLVAAEIQVEYESLIAQLVDAFDGGDFSVWTGMNYRAENFERVYWQNFEGYLGALGPGFDAIVNGLIWSFGVYGFHEGGGTIHVDSIIGDADRRDRYNDNTNNVSDVFGDSVGPWDKHSNGDYEMNSIRNLILTMSQLDSLGATEEAVIRVSHNSENPPKFTMVLPSTQQWLPWENSTPNSILGNLNIIRGDSQMLDASHAVLQDAIKDYYIAHPDAKRPPEVMLGGFSQAGITAGAFAEKYGKEMNVTTLFVVGSPLGKFPDIDPSINVVAYEADGDMVTKVDGAKNAPFIQTIGGDNGGGLGSHNAVLYARMSDNIPPNNASEIDKFFDDHPSENNTKDYYLRD